MALLSREATIIYLVTCAVAQKVLSDRNMGLIHSVFLSVKHQRFVLSVIQRLKTVFWCILSTYMFACWEGKSSTCYFIMAEAGVPTTLFEVNVSLYLFAIWYTAKFFSLRIDLLIGECCLSWVNHAHEVSSLIIFLLVLLRYSLHTAQWFLILTPLEWREIAYEVIWTQNPYFWVLSSKSLLNSYFYLPLFRVFLMIRPSFHRLTYPFTFVYLLSHVKYSQFHN